MNFRTWRLIGILLIVGLMAFSGCGQHNNVVKSQSKATITLKPKNLPTLDSSLYIYELWVAKITQHTLGSDTAFTSLGRFRWDNYYYQFLDTLGEALSGSYELPLPYYDYDRILLSVENAHQAHTLPSGTFMLVDTIVDPSARSVLMRFPIYLFEVNNWKWFCGTPTDNNPTTAKEKGIWLCSKTTSPRDNWDTLAVRGVTVIPHDPVNPADSLLPDTIGIRFPPESLFTVIDTFVVFGYDTLEHKRINIDWIVDTVKDQDYSLFVVYNIDSISDPSRLGSIQYQTYTNPVENLPAISDLRNYGWRYNGWVISKTLPATLPRVFPFGYERQYRITGDTAFYVVPLGGFWRPDSADLSNNHNMNLEVPNFPGSDFLINNPPDVNFRLGSVGPNGNIWGSVVIGMEPDPSKLTIDTMRNFPIFFLADSLRSSTNSPAVDSVHDFHNYSDYLPQIEVVVKFHD